MAKKNLKSFLKNKGKQTDAIDEKIRAEVPADKQADAEQIKSVVEQYEGASESDLMSELARQVEAGKEDGSFNAQTLSQFVSNVSPMLSDEQRSRLNDIVGKL